MPKLGLCKALSVDSGAKRQREENSVIDSIIFMGPPYLCPSTWRILIIATQQSQQWIWQDGWLASSVAILSVNLTPGDEGGNACGKEKGSTVHRRVLPHI
jgi:hypothetical protein